MKVLHVISGLELSYLGGVSTYVRSLAAEQQKNGYDVAIYGSNDKYMPYDFLECKTNKYQAFSINIMNDDKLLMELSNWLETQKFDLIHLHSAFLLPWNVYKVLRNYNYVVSLHDYYYLCPRGAVMVDWRGDVCRKLDLSHCRNCISKLDLYIEKRWILHKMMAGIRRFMKIDLPSKMPRFPQKITDKRYKAMKTLLENANMLLPVSTKTMEIYKEAGINNRYRVVHIGNDSALRYSENYVISPVRHDGCIHIAMIGEMSYIKGAELFIDIVNSVKRKDMCFHFWGKCNQIYNKRLVEIGVINHGKYKHDSLPDILKSIDLAIIPPICDDAGPQVIMELLNSHVPIITTGRGGIPDYVNKQNGYVFEPNKVKKAIDFIQNIDITKINSLKKNIMRTTTPKEHFEELDKIYASLL